ncbi:MAG: hypothetical protein JNK21_08125 [Rhodospirillaceae bacterium]|nr:hypothetical protein [Rhodospirillaceae bacterium]
MNRLTVFSRVAAAVISVGIVSTSLPAFAGQSTASWFATQKQVLTQKLEQAPPVTFKFVGNSMVPVFVKPAPKFLVYVEALDAPASTGGAVKHVALR